MMAKKKIRKPKNVQPLNQNQSRTESFTNKQKGNLVEEIAAMMHDCVGVKVERNVFLTPVNGDPRRKREIDVLLTSYVAGYPVRLAIECKNEAEVTGVEHIGAFIDKLDDVGIPHQQGVFISATGYTSGAIDRAKAKGIRTLALTGLTEDRLSAAVSDAWQYLVYLLPVIKQVSVTNHVAEAPPEIFDFQNEQGELCGFLPDLIWFQWQNREIELTIR